MRRFVPLLVFAVLVFVALERGGFGQFDTVKELAPGVFFRQGDRDHRQQANCGWIIFKDYVLVIDANFPWGARQILPEIKKTTSKPIRFVFDTHYHGDHATGNSVYVDAGATIVCSQDCAAESRTKGQRAWDNDKETGEYSLKPYRLEHPSIVFGKEMTFEDGEHRVELKLMGPGHTKGDAVAYLPKEKILFTGDLCTNWTFGNNVADADADPANWVRALGQMAQWDVQTVVVGHGLIGPRDTLKGQQAYLNDMWTQVSAGKKAGKTADHLVKEINLSKHGNVGASAQRNEESIRAMYRKAG